MSTERGSTAYAAAMLRDLSPSALHDLDLPFEWRVFFEVLDVRAKILRADHERTSRDKAVKK